MSIIPSHFARPQFQPQTAPQYPTTQSWYPTQCRFQLRSLLQPKALASTRLPATLQICLVHLTPTKKKNIIFSTPPCIKSEANSTSSSSSTTPNHGPNASTKVFSLLFQNDSNALNGASKKPPMPMLGGTPLLAAAKISTATTIATARHTCLQWIFWFWPSTVQFRKPYKSIGTTYVEWVALDWHSATYHNDRMQRRPIHNTYPHRELAWNRELVKRVNSRFKPLQVCMGELSDCGSMTSDSSSRA